MSSPSFDDIKAVVDSWFQEKVRSAPLAYHTECYNQMSAARSDLDNRLAAAFGETIAPPAPPADAAEPEAETAEAPADASKSSKTSSKTGA